MFPNVRCQCNRNHICCVSSGHETWLCRNIYVMSAKTGRSGNRGWISAISADLPRSRSSGFNQSLHGAGFWVTCYQRIGINGDIEACKKTKPPTSLSSPLSRSPLLTLSPNWWRERFNWEADSWWLSWLIFSAIPPGLARQQHHSHHHQHYHQHYHHHYHPHYHQH